MQTDNLNNPATPATCTAPEPTKTQPLSPRKLASTRANGALSLGPKTAAGLAKMQSRRGRPNQARYACPIGRHRRRI